MGSITPGSDTRRNPEEVIALIYTCVLLLTSNSLKLPQKNASDFNITGLQKDNETNTYTVRYCYKKKKKERVL